jgi:hypothetical protein
MVLRSIGAHQSDIVQILFIGVARLEVDQHYNGGITIATVDSHGAYPTDPRFPKLFMEIISPGAEGLVVASAARITRLSMDGQELELLAASKRPRDA